MPEQSKQGPQSPETASGAERDLLDRAAPLIRELEASSRERSERPLGRSGWMLPFRLPPPQEWPALERLAGSADWGQPQIGDLPPSPPTLRARLGRVVVALIRRALQWYSGQLGALHRLIAQAADEQLGTLRQLASGQEEQGSDLASLHQALDRLERKLEGVCEERKALQAELHDLRGRLDATAGASDKPGERP